MHTVPLPYTQMDDSHYWVDDPDSSYYNQFVSTKDVEKDWDSAEHLVDYPNSYRYALAIDYNTECVPGAGSAFFIHCSNGAPTYGYVAIPQDEMVFLLQHLSARAYDKLEKRLDVLYKLDVETNQVEKLLDLEVQAEETKTSGFAIAMLFMCLGFFLSLVGFSAEIPVLGMYGLIGGFVCLFIGVNIKNKKKS